MRFPERRSVLLIRNSLLRWYTEYRRNLAWRSVTDPYKILISEIMLQQTQVDRVRKKFPLFLRSFPTIQSLASAAPSDVIRAWQGMGYNNRAVRLREMAKVIVEKYGGHIPGNSAALQELPGIGPYTANAVACFAFRQEVAVVDVNVRRVLSRLFRRARTSSHFEEEKVLLNLAQTLLPRDAYTWNQAMMELGALVCTARRPACHRCPLMKQCKSSHLGKMKNTPVRSTRKREPSHDGIPTRLWRGKIVEQLRSLDDHQTIPVPKLGKMIKQNFRRDETGWLMGILRSLSSDGIVTLHRDRSIPAVKLAEE